jgi:hypothetical protein
MSMLRAIFVMTTLTAVQAAESIVPEPENINAQPNHSAELSDFIVPFASDIRFGYSANVGSYHRTQDAGEGTDSHFIEHGLWVSYVRALSGPGRALSGRAEWRAEVGLLFSQAQVSNPNDSTGTLRTAMLDVGIGPAWKITENDTSRLEFEIMPFAGIGFSDYGNDYATELSGFRGATSVSANGLCLEYGIKANIMWCWSNGWGAALHAGLVQRASRLEGESTTNWSNGQVSLSNYSSDDILTGVRFGLFVARRF